MKNNRLTYRIEAKMAKIKLVGVMEFNDTDGDIGTREVDIGEMSAEEFNRLVYPPRRKSLAYVSKRRGVFAEGVKVRHERFGDGVIAIMEDKGDAYGIVAYVVFDNHGVKQLIMKFATALTVKDEE